MKVFLTGATGFIGSALIPELIGAGHTVLGLARSDAGADALKAAGAEVHRGDLEDLESLRSGAAASDGVIHCGFVHDFSRFEEVCAIDRKAIETLGNELKGSDRLLVVTSGTGMGSAAQGQTATEEFFNPHHPNPRAGSEIASTAITDAGGKVAIVRLPQVHDPYKQGLITYAVSVAREKGVVGYLGEGLNRWPAVHVRDCARLYRLALEKNVSGARYHAVAEEGVQVKEIAESLGRGLKLPVVSMSPEEAGQYFGWLAMFAGMDMPASSVITQERLGWKPTGPTLLSDLDQAKY